MVTNTTVLRLVAALREATVPRDQPPPTTTTMDSLAPARALSATRATRVVSPALARALLAAVATLAAAREASTTTTRDTTTTGPPPPFLVMMPKLPPLPPSPPLVDSAILALEAVLLALGPTLDSALLLGPLVVPLEDLLAVLTTSAAPTEDLATKEDLLEAQTTSVVLLEDLATLEDLLVAPTTSVVLLEDLTTVEDLMLVQTTLVVLLVAQTTLEDLLVAQATSVVLLEDLTTVELPTEALSLVDPMLVVTMAMMMAATRVATTLLFPALPTLTTPS
jgi:hypothetical protein